jgi:hypothetical protein
MMQLAILHYHLNRGGVSRVVENHLLALAAAAAQPERVVVMHGGRADGWPQQRLARQLPFPLQTTPVAGLDYDSLDDDPLQAKSIVSTTGDSADTSQDAQPTGHFVPDGLPSGHSPRLKVIQLADRIVDVLNRAQFERARTLIHWHNHALGKNASVPLVVTELARRGYRMLLQIHDFAEDLRPDNYRYLAETLTPNQIDRLPEVLYPQSTAIHYAVLTGRDRQLLSEAGVADGRLHLLPNPVSSPIGASTDQIPETGTSDRPLSNQPPADQAEARRHLATLLDMPVDATWITYPVRGIRRKNVGEMLLWSAVVADESSRPVWLHITMTPENPVERASFRRWQRLAKQLDLPCRFGTPAGAQVSFEHVLAACDLLLTTSIAEGFGMVFLECWLAGRRLVGRDLPEITTDFRQAGVRLESLAPQLAIPTAWIDCGRLAQTLDDLYEALRVRYGQPPSTVASADSPFASLMEEPTIDFARLPAQMQAYVIRRAHHDPEARAQLRELNGQLKLASPHPWGPEAGASIDANRRVVEQAYSLARIGHQLMALYTQLLNTEPSPHIDTLPRGKSLLESLLRPDRLYPIRIEP